MGEESIAIAAGDGLTAFAAVPRASRLMQDIAVARRVIRAEINGLEQLAETLNGAFGLALDMCAAVRGRLIVTGIGKSGHVARKIAATLASTGTPAQFVHPAEASHGDLGMIGGEDAILALSNSGESAELADIIAYSRRFKIPLIAITGGADSTLAEAADAVLPLPHAAEACSMGLAPTTSTTMMMALGDALAIALIERKGFSPTDGDLRRHMDDGLLSRSVSEIMHPGPKTVTASNLAAEALGLMNRFAITALFVVDDKQRPTGFLHMHDCLRAGIA